MLIVKGNRSHNTAAFTTPYNFCQKKCCHSTLYLVEISRLHRNKKKWTEFKLKYGFDQTPAFILFKNGKVNSMIQWDEKKGLSSDSFHRWLEENRNDIENLS